jgi:hypothetical protein
MRVITFFLLLVTSQPLMASEDEYLIEPMVRVGKITPNTSETDLVLIYGRENVKRSEIGVGEGDVVMGTILFPYTDKELSIEWKANFSKPVRISIYGDDTKWKTTSGISIGTTLEELEQINSGIFKLTGFGWDYPGRTVSWEMGSLPKQLQLDLWSQTDISSEEIGQVLGDSYFDSSNLVFRKMKLKVRQIYVRWDI